MYRDHDVELKDKISEAEYALIQDLELETLFDAMGLGDKFIIEVSKKIILSSLKKPDEISYRQEILKDCLKYPDVLRELYAIALDSIKGEKKTYFGFFSDYPSSILGRAVEVLGLFATTLRKLRTIADEYHEKIESEGLKVLFAMIRHELDDEYLSTVQNHLKELKFSRGVLVGARLGEGNNPTNLMLHKQPGKKQGRFHLALSKNRSQFTYTLPDRDMSGATEISVLRDRSINTVANATAISTDHILAFFNMLRTELAFYLGCLNLQEQLVRKTLPICFPVPAITGICTHSSAELYDVCLALKLQSTVVCNDLAADRKELVIITGANRGGKSTFLRSVGLAQLMMQCGMFAPARSLSADIYDGIYTHFRREEDSTMNSGKLDEELGRMSQIVESLEPHSLLLFNESFAATNEREGSEIARHIIRALIEYHVRIFFVTHFYELAEDFYRLKADYTLFLRAERHTDGNRTFKIKEGIPLPTSFGEDLYERIFGSANRPAEVASVRTQA
jgi:DNA mismatch repair ATPase MutS